MTDQASHEPCVWGEGERCGAQAGRQALTVLNALLPLPPMPCPATDGLEEAGYQVEGEVRGMWW